MVRFLLAGALLAAAGCALPPERPALRPLPDEAASLPYAELLTRARIQASMATEAFYVNRWNELEDAARGLEQTARFLPRAEDVPPRHKDTLAVVSADLGKEAAKLRDAAKGQNVKETNDILQRVTLKVRELRLDN
jgi:hypothetical protein